MCVCPTKFKIISSLIRPKLGSLGEGSWFPSSFVLEGFDWDFYCGINILETFTVLASQNQKNTRKAQVAIAVSPGGTICM